MYDEGAETRSLFDDRPPRPIASLRPASLFIRMIDCFADGNRQEAKEAAAELRDRMSRGSASPLYTAHLRADDAARLQCQLRYVLARFADAAE